MEIAYIFALLSVLFVASNSVLTRYVMKRFRDYWAFSVAIQVFILLAFIPVLVIFRESIVFSFGHFPLILLLLVSLLRTIVIVYSYKAHRLIDLGSRAILQKTKLMWAVCLSITFLGESLTILQIFGITLIFTGSVIISLNKGGNVEAW